MKREEKLIFCELLLGIAELYSKALSPKALNIYWNIFERYPLDMLKRALQLHLENPDNGQFMPKPADILRYIEGKTAERALQAWTYALSGAREVGKYESIEFEDRLIHAVIKDMGGWVNFGLIEKHDLPFKAQEFQRRYIAYLINPPSEIPPHLQGICEHINQVNGYPIAPPTFFSLEKHYTLLSQQKILDINEEKGEAI